MTTDMLRTLSYNKRIFVILCLLSILVVRSSAQTTFQKTYGDSSTTYPDVGNSLVQTTDGGFIIAGTRNNAMGFESIFLIRTNAAGDTIWTRFIKEAVIRYTATQMIATSDNNFVVTGYKSDGPTCFPFLVKFDSLGNILWNKSYDMISDARFFTIIQLPDSGFLAGGIHGYDAFFVRTDASGDTIWSRLYSATNYAFSITSIAAAPDGGFVSCGYSGTGLTPDAFLMKIDSSGNFIWAKSYGGSFFDYASQLVSLNDQGYVVAATSYSFGLGGNDGDFFLFKTDTAGNLDWSKIYGGTAEDICPAVNQYPDGSLLFSGSSRSFLSGSPDIYVIKTDAAGDTLWTEVFNGLTTYDGRASVLTSDGGFAITGDYFYSDGHTFLARADASGYLGCNESRAATALTIPNVQVNTVVMTTSQAQPIVNSYILNGSSGADVNVLCLHTETPGMERLPDLNLFPNPVTDECTARSIFKIYSVGIFNMLGEKIFAATAVNREQLTVNCKLIPKGIYFVKVETANGTAVQKLVKQ